MVAVHIYHYNAFSVEIDKGNPAGVVMDGNALSDRQMLDVARQVGFNETVFVLNSDVAALRLRYFTPGHEINLCGHATVASLIAMRSIGVLIDETITVETNAGVLPMRVTPGADGRFVVTMQQAPPEFVAFKGSIDDLMASIGLTSDDLDLDLPVVFGSTGTWTLLVPIKKLGAFERMIPHITCLEANPPILAQLRHHGGYARYLVMVILR